jgi:hypothetical protein
MVIRGPEGRKEISRWRQPPVVPPRPSAPEGAADDFTSRRFHRPAGDLCKSLVFPVRHPERSEAKGMLASAGGPERSRRTSQFFPGTTETDLARSNPGRAAVLSRRELAVRRTFASRPRRSFGSGSAESFGQTHLPLAFAQNDGALFARRDFCRDLLQHGNCWSNLPSLALERRLR